MERSFSFNQLNEEAGAEAETEADSISSCSEASSIGSLDSDFAEEVGNSSTSSAKHQLSMTDPLHDMSSLLHQLPSKRGLSKHYQGKSQSFTSLSEVKCLEDLAKPENPYSKKLKSSKSYAAGIAESICHHPCPPKTLNSNKASSSQRALCSKRNNNNGSFLGSRPPIHPHRSASTSSFSSQTALFA